ncbi:unnamed protein product [Timema podura]|uniref:Uncharacterized protein n=1 Tax=Timema podura TaxID=61482 RepID=A0ABN7PSW7_TIMPD|nr:unnamed protein product [Timema podura]
MNVKMVYLLTTVLVSMMTALSSASRSAQLDNYIRIRNNYLIPLAQAASEAYNASFDDAFKVSFFLAPRLTTRLGYTLKY